MIQLCELKATARQELYTAVKGDRDASDRRCENISEWI